MTTGFDVTASADADSLKSALKRLGPLAAPHVVAPLTAAGRPGSLRAPPAPATRSGKQAQNPESGRP